MTGMWACKAVEPQDFEKVIGWNYHPEMLSRLAETAAKLALFDGTGVGLQDLAVASAAVDLAVAKGVAIEVGFRPADTVAARLPMRCLVVLRPRRAEAWALMALTPH